MAYSTLSRKRKAVAALIMLELIEGDDERKWKRGPTREWMKRREEQGYYDDIVRELSIEDTAAYKEMMRMCYEEFLYILNIIEKDITPTQIFGGHKVIPAKARLTVTIRFLATGETFRSLCFQFRISKGAISYIARDVCNGINKNMSPLYLKVPLTMEEWLEISRKFEERWQFPNCVGAIDGKHIVMQPPPEAGSHFFNYKHTHSIILMAIAEPDYECLYAYLGTNGRASDGGVWSKSSLSNAIENGDICLPPPKCLPFGAEEMPHVFVADDAFALKPYLMKPYPQSGLTEERRIYNYRHSRARRISENLVGIIANRWRVFRSVILLPPTTIEVMLMSTLTIHNFLRQSPSRSIYCPAGLLDLENRSGDFIPGIWCNDSSANSVLPLPVPSTGHNASKDAKRVRETFKEYFCNEGAVDWQWDRC